VTSKRFQLTWRNTLLLFCSLGALAVFFAFAGPASAMRDVASATPSVVSDQADYNPGATVTLTGTDWGSGEIVHVTVNDDVGQTWAYNTDVTADDAGNFTLRFQLPNTFVANYRVTATGSSGAAAQTTFTDSQPQAPIVASPTSVTVAAGGTANFGTVTVTMNGNSANCTVTLNTAGLPPGATAAFGNSPVTTNATFTSSFSIATTAATAPGTYSFTVTASRGANCQGNGVEASTPLSLTVTSACTPPSVATQPGDVSVTYGANASFTAAAGGSPTVQWQVSTNGGTSYSDLPGATSATLSLTRPPASSSGNKYHAVFTNTCGSATSNAATLTIARKNLIVNGASANSRTYDGTDNATVSFAGATLSGVISPDVVSIDSSVYAAHFDNKNVGNGKPVTVTGVALGGVDVGNYSLSQPSGLNANVTQRDLTAAVAAANKTYDRTAAATITGCTLDAAAANHGAISGDNVGCSGSNGHFGSASAGTAKAVTADVALTGAGAGNYHLTSTSASTTADIDKRDVSATISAADKTYDGTDSASITGCSLETQLGNHGVISPDVVGCSGSNGHFNSKNAGPDKAVSANVTLTGADKDNYRLTSPSASTTANIGKRDVTASITAADKVYDGTDGATISACALNAESGGVGKIAGDNVGCTGSNGHFTGNNAGTNRPVSADVALTGGDAGNYQLTAGSASTAATIDKRSVTASIAASDKLYDGTSGASITGCSLEAQTGDHGVVSPDDVGCSASNGAFGNKNAGLNRAVSADVALTGADHTNYQLTSATAETNANIGKRDVTASIAAGDKTYDGTDAATITSCSLESQDGDHGTISGDEVDCAGSNAHFDTKNAGSNKPVSASITLMGGDANNYQLTSTSASTTAKIARRDVTASISADDKTYDGTDAATITSCSLEGQTADHGVVSPDDAGCSATNGAFGNRNAGVGKTASADVGLTGADKDNYQLTSSTAATTANVARRHVTASVTAADKTYDGTDAASIVSCALEGQEDNHGVISPDAVDCAGSNGHFDDRHAGASKSVTADVALAGAAADNYQLTSASASTTASIGKRDVTASIAAADKTYDGTDAASITNCSLDAESGLAGKISGDDVDCSASNGHFDNGNAGANKPVSADVELAGNDKTDYHLTSGTAATMATIDPRPVTASISAPGRTYDGTDVASISECSLETQDGNHGVISPDDVGCSASNGRFADKNAGSDKPVTADTALAGADKDNYQLTGAAASTTASIDKRDVTASIAAADKPYDGTAAAEITDCSLNAQTGLVGKITGDDLDCAAANAHFGNKNAAPNKPVAADVELTGGDKANYQLTSASATTTATIEKRSVTASISAANKTYDGTDAASITDCSLEAQHDNHGVISSEDVGCSGSNGRFATRNAGDGKTVTGDVALIGAEKDNYQLTSVSASTTANIGERDVTASVTAADKTFDGTDAAAVTSCALDASSGDHGAISGDAVGCSGSNGRFDDRNAGPNKPVSADVALTGADKNNYQLTSGTAATQATIHKRNVTASIIAADKTYDGTDAATLTGCSLETQAGNHGVVPPDAVDCAGSNGHFASATAGNGKSVTGGVVLTGADKDNYQLTSGTAATTANIDRRHVTAAITAADKTYDGTTAASITGCALEAQSGDHGMISPDDVGCAGSNGHFSDKSAGNGKSVTGDVALSGSDKDNYQLTAGTASTTASIVKRDVTPSITAGNKVYDGNDAAAISNCSLDARSGDHGAISGDSIGCSGSNGHFNDKNVGNGKPVTADVAPTGSDAGNYRLTSASAATTANVTKAPLTVRADDKTMTINGPVPSLTYAITGFVGGETLATSGVSGTAGCTTANGTVAGTFPINCALGSLSSNNYSFAFVPGTLTVNYAATCQGAPIGNPILQPVNGDGSSTFKQGSTVPLKFRACDAGGNSFGPTSAVPNIVASFVLDHTSNGAPGVNEAVDSTTPDTAFRWSATDKQWIFNLSTKNLSAGKTYTYKVTLVGGASFTIVFGLK